MSSRDTILNRLRTASKPFPDVADAPENYLPMTPLADKGKSALRQRFIAEAEKLSSMVYQPASASAAIETIIELLGDDKEVISWDDSTMPLPLLKEALNAAGVDIASPNNPTVRVGLSGANAALAATGTLVVASGTGQYRNASLLPPVHVAVITDEQIMADFESWVAAQRAGGLETFRTSSNVVLISGASRTADIAMQLILGMHGPRELHIIILPSAKE